MKRDHVVIVEFPYTDGGRGKNRPALVIQIDRDNGRLANTLIAMISGNIRHVAESTQLLVDPATADGGSSGLHGASVVKCCNLFTVRQVDMQRTIGHLSNVLQTAVYDALRDAIGVP